MPTVTITLGAQQVGNGYGPSGQSAAPNKLSLRLGRGPQDITFNLSVASGSPATTQMLFTQNANGWGNVAPITWKTITPSDVGFPPGWSAAQQAAFLASLQAALNGIVVSSPPGSPSTATLTLNPSTLEAGNGFQIDLPYTVNYWINVNGESWGPQRFDPEVDILPGSGSK